MDLYMSALFQKAWAYAQTFQAERIYILPAERKLLSPTTLVPEN